MLVEFKETLIGYLRAIALMIAINWMAVLVMIGLAISIYLE
jgi:hypothetical protein